MNNRLIDIIRKFEGQKIAVVGDVSVDSYIYGMVPNNNPEMPGAPLLRVNRRENKLGCAANVAANAQSLGADATLHGVVGRDMFGKELRDLLAHQNLHASLHEEHETIVKERVIEESHRHYICRVDFGEDQLSPISDTAQSYLMDELLRNPSSAIILSDYNKRVFTGSFAPKVISYAQTHNIPTIVDPKPQNIDSFRGATLISPNLLAARDIIGVGKNYEKLAYELRERTGSTYSVITLGKEGMATCQEQYQHIPTHAREVVDVMGAGDTVKAALALSIASGASLVEASHIANYAAGIVVEKQGTATASVAELVARINDV